MSQSTTRINLTLKRKRKKVLLVCLFCRLAHMTCDEDRPCQRCIEHNISCHDAPSPLPTPPDDDDDEWDHSGSDIRYYLIAADPQGDTAADRLNAVINAKYEAGYLKPYNYVNGYARLQRYMDQSLSPDSRQRILDVMGTFRPTFREVARALTDVDLILVEEAFERLLLDYDRVFSAMAIPACLWRRTGEIYKGNAAFARLINVPLDDLQEGRLCIYEIMAEESTVNYWEKYGNVAFDPRQKAVLTSCLICPPKSTLTLSCCFSFTLRRDKYNM